MKLFNYILDNDILFYGMFIGVACHFGLTFISSIYFDNIEVTDKGVQTDAWEDYSDRPSQILLDNTTSIDTQTPQFSPIEYIDTASQTMAGDSSTVTTVLPIPPVSLEIIPNPDITNRVIEYSVYAVDYADKLEQLAHMLTGF